MSNFTVNFTHPWLLLLLIPAALLTVLLYLRLPKKYRRNRNRITSIILHSVVMVLAISALAGISFSYDIPNRNNEILVLVDLSHSSREEEDKKNEFVKGVIDACGDQYKVGVVTFGYDRVYAAPLSHDTDKVYEEYLSARRPDPSATDLASALTYAQSLFTNPEAGKIVLLSDGVETDRNATTVIRSVAAAGIRVDTVYFGSSFRDEVEITAIQTPDYNITPGDEFTLGLTLKSDFAGRAEVVLHDTSDMTGTKDFAYALDFVKGTQQLEITHSFEVPGMHELQVEIKADGDTLTQNNSYYTYIDLAVRNKILLVEYYEGDAARLDALLSEQFDTETEKNVTAVNLRSSPDSLPDTVNELRKFDEVILVNVAYENMPEGFERILYSYVNDYGGGLLTVGGNKLDDAGNEIIDPVTQAPTPNAYNRDDMRKSQYYQQLLPVQAVDYTPPLGVMFVIDRSGSMDSEDTSTGMKKLELAKASVIACLDGALSSDRDWAGVMTLDDDFAEDVEMMPLTRRTEIREAVEEISGGGGTVFAGALERAGSALQAIPVERKHIVLVTDGQPSDHLFDGTDETGREIGGYGEVIRRNFENGITCSIVSINKDGNQADMLRAAEELGGGKFYDAWDTSTLPIKMTEDLNRVEIKEVIYEEFQPTIEDHTNVTSGIAQEDIPTLFGFYGTRLKSGASVPLMGEYVPVYAQWKFGEGTVGSWMCDLSGNWSANLFDEDETTNSVGEALIYNIVNGIFPTTDIRPKDIEITLNEDNYTTQMSVYTKLQEGQSVSVIVTSPPDESGERREQVFTPTEDEGYTRFTFTITQPGIHSILVQKKDAGGNVIDEYSTYKVFSYSEEYDVFVEEGAGEALLQNLATLGEGAAITAPREALERLTKELHRDYDPRVPLMIAAIVLFLLDVAVRKFKFKWIHEIVRDRKLKAEMLGKGKGAKQTQN